MRQKKRKITLVLALVLPMLFVSAGAEPPLDVILLFDMDRASTAWFAEAQDYLSGAFLKEFLRTGDTFHLISFADTARLEVSRKIEGEGDYRTVIGRILLLYPFARNTSLDAAQSYIKSFTETLPAGRRKTVVLWTPQTVDAASFGAGLGANVTLISAQIPQTIGTLKSARQSTAAVKPAVKNETMARPVVQPEIVVQPKIVNEPEVIKQPEVVVKPEAASQPSVALQPSAVLLDAPPLEIIPGVDINPSWKKQLSGLAFIFPFAALSLLFPTIILCAAAFGKSREAEKRKTESAIAAELERISGRGLLQRALDYREKTA